METSIIEDVDVGQGEEVEELVSVLEEEQDEELVPVTVQLP